MFKFTNLQIKIINVTLRYSFILIPFHLHFHYYYYYYYDDYSDKYTLYSFVKRLQITTECYASSPTNQTHYLSKFQNKVKIQPYTEYWMPSFAKQTEPNRMEQGRENVWKGKEKNHLKLIINVLLVLFGVSSSFRCIMAIAGGIGATIHRFNNIIIVLKTWCCILLRAIIKN